VLDRALPELGEALARRQADPFELDPVGALRWPRLSRLQEVEARRALKHPERLLMAALVLDATEGGPQAVAVARRMVQRLDQGAAAEQAVAGLVGDAELLPAAARRADSLDEEAVLQLAVHLRSSEQEQALMLLASTGDDLEPWERERLRELHELLQAVLAHPELTGRDAANAIEQRRAAAGRLTTDPAVQDRIRAAPRAYVLATPPADLARQSALCEPPPRPDEVRVSVLAAGDHRWRVEVVARDRVGLLAADTDVLTEAGLDIVEATVATWGDRCALASFLASSETEPAAETLEERLRLALKRPRSTVPLPDATVTFDGQASPWHTLCRVEAPDSPGLLYGVTAAFAAAGASVHSAKITTVDGMADDHFALTDANGHKLAPSAEEEIRRTVAAGRTAPGAGLWARWRQLLPGAPASRNGRTNDTKSKQSGHQPEIPTS
jgi:[protein-PII] uridylyltransferase